MHLLHKCFKSIISQKNINFDEVEIVLVFDGKNTFVEKFCIDFFPKNLKVKIFFQDNSGLTKALNYGLSKCEGKYVARIDCDDEWHEDKLSLQLDYLNHNSEVYLLGTGWQNIDQFENKINKVNRIIHSNEIKKELFIYNFFNHSSIIFDRKIVKDIGGYDERFTYAQDYILWSNLLRKKPNGAALLDKVLVNRQHIRSSFNKKSKQLWASCVARLNLLDIETISLIGIKNLFKSYLGYVFLQLLQIIKIETLFNTISQNDYFHGPLSKSDHFKKNKLYGYMRDFRLKFIEEKNYDGLYIQKFKNGNQILLHPITVCQTGLGIYELYIRSKLPFYKEKFLEVAELLVDLSKKDNQGIYWEVPMNFKLFNLDENFRSGLIQGQAISVFLRAYEISKEEKFKELALEAFNILNENVENGGCSRKNKTVFEEYPKIDKIQTVLNGLIYSIFPIYELYISTNNEKYLIHFNRCIESLEQDLSMYDAGYWSRYSVKNNSLIYNNLASPYYHKEHILQLEVLYELTGSELLNNYRKKWAKQKNKKINLAYVIFFKSLSRIFQKILSR